MVLCRLVEVLGELASCEVRPGRAVERGELASGEDLLVLEQQRSRLEAVVARAAARFEAEDDHAGEVARTATVWLTARTGKDGSPARPDEVGARRRLSIGVHAAARLEARAGCSGTVTQLQ